MNDFVLKLLSFSKRTYDFFEGDFANILSVYAIYLGIKNSHQYREKNEVLPNENFYKVDFIEYWNQHTGKIERDTCSHKGIYHFGCNVHNYSSSSLHVHNLGLTDEKGNELTKYANTSIAIQSPTNIIIYYDDKSLGQSTFLFQNTTTRNLSGKSTLQIDMLFVVPFDVKSVLFRIPIAKRTKTSKFFNHRFIKSVFKNTKIDTGTKYNGVIMPYSFDK